MSRTRVRSAFPLPVNKVNITGADIDRLGADGGYEALSLHLQAGTWTDGTHAFQIQHAVDNGSGAPGTYNNVSSTALDTEQNASFASITSAPTAVNQKVGYIGGLRWVRVNVTVTGSPATGAAYLINAVMSEARNQPTTA